MEDITLRHTILKSIENRRIVIPNSVISREQILNSSIKDERIQFHLEVVITYQSDHNLAMAIMREEAMKHPLFIDGRNIRLKMEKAEILPVKVVGLESYGIRLRAWVWAKNNNDAFDAKCDLMKTLKERFRETRIEFATDIAALRRTP
ncbi:MAG: mechanosensitive ion channel family protein [Bacteroidetes bacterium]|nr:mechanosensitive ion channel family protein [Bacteroidota bacterium]